jgi:hypothetical protein
LSVDPTTSSGPITTVLMRRTSDTKHGKRTSEPGRLVASPRIRGDRKPAKARVQGPPRCANLT